ncbi:MAG: terminase large subunit [Geminicoccaceae bacterium]
MGTRGPGARPARRALNGTTKPKPWESRRLSTASRLIAFIESLKLTSGAHAGKPFRLRAWQKRIIRAIFRPGVKTALVTLPRGSGKTQLCAGIMLGRLCGPLATPRAELYSAACDRHQAARIYREALAMALADPDLADRIVAREYIKTLTDQETGSVYQALSADSRKGMGLAPDLAIYDELGSAPDRELYDALDSGLGKKAGSTMIVISTQAPRDDHVMSELVDHGRKVNAGEIADRSFSATIYSAPMDADPWSPKTWRACNPALGDFCDLHDFRRMAAQAKRSPSFETGFRLFRLNQRVSATTGVIGKDDWLACAGDAEPAGPCWCGLDTASVSDLAALVAYWPETGAIRCWFWTPAETLVEREHSDRAPFTAWARAGLLLTTPGRTIDLRAPVLQLGELIGDYDVRGVAHDRWRVAELRRLVEDLGVPAPLVEFGQGYRDMGPALDAWERATLSGYAIRHGGHPILTWCVSNAVIEMDPAGNRKATKAKSTGRIDGLVAMIMAIGLHAREPAPRKYDFSQPMVITAA